MEREKNGVSRIAREWEGSVGRGSSVLTRLMMWTGCGVRSGSSTLARMGAERLWRLMHERPSCPHSGL